MAKQALIVLITVLAFGILVPWYKGFTFLDPRMLAAYGCIGILFVAPATAESFAALPDGLPATSTLSRLGVLIGFGWGLNVLVVVSAIATLNIAYGHGNFIAPQPELFLSIVVCSLAGSALVGALSAVLARTLSAGSVKAILRLAFLLILLAFIFSARMPDAWQIALMEHTTRRAITRLAWEGSVICAVAAGLLLIPLLKRANTAEASSSAANPL